jgi:tripartite-type tricarboxylate transporter receptor subunit TctC
MTDTTTPSDSICAHARPRAVWQTARRVSTMLLAAAATLAGLAPGAALAQDWPSKPVRIIVPYPPGGQTDAVARWLGDKLSPALGQPVVIDNKPGAQAIIGITAAKQSAPDGYTYVFVNTSNIVINRFQYRKLGYDALTDFEPVAQLGNAPLGMVVPATLGIRSVDDFVAYARRNPGKVTFASFGTGSSSHLYGEMLKTLTGLDMVHVPYKGAGPAVQDIASGNATMGIHDYATTTGLIQAGKLVVIATTGSARLKSFPEVRTFVEQGYPLELVGWLGVMAPKGTPAPIVERMSREITRALRTPEGVEKSLQNGMIATGSTPAEFAEIIRSAYPGWGAAFKASGAEPE